MHNYYIPVEQLQIQHRTVGRLALSLYLDLRSERHGRRRAKGGRGNGRTQRVLAVIMPLLSLAVYFPLSQPKPITHIDLVTLKVPQGEELIKLDKVEPKRRGDLNLAVALELRYRRLGMVDDLVARPTHAEKSSKNWIRRLAEALGAHGNNILVVGSVILDKVARQHLLFACVQC